MSQERLRAMCQAIHHRGPDDEGFHWRSHVGLGMRRLSIIDLAGGKQPIFNEDGSIAIVFNGEIYNYRELRHELLQKGHTLRTQGDTETIVHLYEELDVDCVTRLRGMFAFAIWNETTRTLLLARDRFGIKPLYVVTADWGIAFASELKALHAAGFTGDLDWTALDTFLRLGYAPAPLSPFQNVRKIEPGHFLVWRESNWIDRRYWDLPVRIRDEPRDVEARLLAQLDESVRAHMVSDVPVAAFLSGGLDSSAVVSSMALAGVTPHAFTARYHGTGAGAADETALAYALAERYGARITVVDVEPNVRDLLEPIVYALDEPHADESSVPSWLLSKQVASEYKVALAGTGGDELFAGYRRHLGLLLSSWYHRLPGWTRRAAGAIAFLLPEPAGGSLAVHRLKRFLRARSASLPHRYVQLMNRFPEELPGGLYGDGLETTIRHAWAHDHFEALYREAGAPDGLRGPLYLDYKTYLPDDPLHLADRIAMAHSLEVRVPFVDHVFVEHAFPLPDHVKIGFGRSKHLLRRALKGRLSSAHARAPKRGFVGPTALWLRHELRDTLRDELSPDRLHRLGYFNHRAVNRLVEAHETRQQNYEGILWALLVFSTWHRLYVEADSRRPCG